MTRLNWEKQNRAELPKLKRRESQRTKILKAYENGAKREREHIVRLLTAEMERIEQWTDYPATNALANIRAELIKGEQK
jgi:hypothetical protein